MYFIWLFQLTILFIMIIGFQEKDIQTWKSSLFDYEHNKRTKLIPGYDAPKPTREVFKSQPTSLKNIVTEVHTTPNLQTPTKIKPTSKEQNSLHKYLYNSQKYQKPYDIVTLHPINSSAIQLEPITPNKNQAPIRNLHDIINGSPISEQYLKNRVVVLPPHYVKRQIKDSREFNIINNEYKGSNEQRTSAEEESQKLKILDHYRRKHIYDKIYNRFYNPEEEQHYWQLKMEKDRQIARQNFDLKLPPSYQVRERFIQDATKPFPEGLVKFKQRMENAKKHHQLKYLKEHQYTKKNIEAEGKDQRRSINRIHITSKHRQNKSQILTNNAYTKDREKIKGIGFKND